MSRRDCMDWWKERYDRPLERSACVACPFQSRSSVGSRRSAGGRSCSPRRWRSTPTCGAGWPSPKSPICISLRIPLAQAVRQDEAELGNGRAIGRVRKRVRGSLWRLIGAAAFDAAPPIRYDYGYRQVGPAMLSTPRAAAPPAETGDASGIVLLADPLPTGGGSF